MPLVQWRPTAGSVRRGAEAAEYGHYIAYLQKLGYLARAIEEFELEEL
ncbi:MAG TPA: hypothetical protein VMT79_02095 [Candidatus Binatia bacterium]|nr:hypothetical protein [Candidatus Binatia bacterium]